jgi:nucleoid DNA-binding protein
VNPKSHKELRKDIADEVGVHNSVVDEFITFYYSKLRRKLSDIDFPRIHVDGLGTFYLRKNKLEKAIKKINPNAEFSINAEDYNQITWLNGTTPISKSDIEAMIPTVEQEEADAATKKINDKASANAKLKALGLTDDEIEALK